jgi:hypothetical protein
LLLRNAGFWVLCLGMWSCRWEPPTGNRIHIFTNMSTSGVTKLQHAVLQSFESSADWRVQTSVKSLASVTLGSNVHPWTKTETQLIKRLDRFAFWFTTKSRPRRLFLTPELYILQRVCVLTSLSRPTVRWIGIISIALCKQCYEEHDAPLTCQSTVASSPRESLSQFVYLSVQSHGTLSHEICQMLSPLSVAAVLTDILARLRLE